jgi:hypothetical protein
LCKNLFCTKSPLTERLFVQSHLDEQTRAALVPYAPIDFVGKPVLPVALHRALKKAEELTDL